MDFKVLVVEDDSASMDLVVDYLEVMGITDIIKAKHGVSALTKVEYNKIDLIICDWNLPIMNGLEFYETIQKNNSINDIPFLMISAENNREKIVEALNIGVKNYIVKPFAHETFKNKVKDLLDI